MLTAEIHVTLKELVLDPQGTTLKRSMETMGYQGIEDVRMGKFIQVRFNSDDRKEVEEKVKEMCQKILSNPVIEQYSYSLTEGK
ncbi:MAG: phosphoribosylformylglycinamidine synthase subunit PurS [Candidatus Edwardsbacteria bacterium]|nr:phosphoribosylformylglycinamidine synthase subunit PurS [Candidatus Edwardsbacteria bacterium]MBU1575997.1 phosphoribosylformylglycinamidine synthase subunit PurS [Candidatus Edwardsbacteria bacterium]MBU2463607.1 phosphoribosylformylglycinamidine synthase subunit PurS [Candidatus Edwardsbacteria bacterium]MBU2593719.1 phosphoribosylformylglycinamidine synthase subunit PurS [Candidatus Edwardsbacteria bacterium]